MNGLCPQCLAANIVAAIGSPTCTHHPLSGAKWWPAGYDKMPEHERLKWHADQAKRQETK